MVAVHCTYPILHGSMKSALSLMVLALLLCFGTTVGATEPDAQAARNTSFNTVVLLQGDASFDFDKASLTENGTDRLDALANRLRPLEQLLSIHVIGHADSIGRAAYNHDLSFRRARSVATYFSRRFPGTRVSFAASGEAHPVADNATAAGRRGNRRVEIEIVAVGDQRVWQASQ